MCAGISRSSLSGRLTILRQDCAKYLNGRGVGARYDGTFSGSTRVGSCTGLTGATSTFSAAYKTFLRQMFEAQTITFEKNARGWIYCALRQWRRVCRADVRLQGRGRRRSRTSGATRRASRAGGSRRTPGRDSIPPSAAERTRTCRFLGFLALCISRSWNTTRRRGCYKHRPDTFLT